MAPKTDTTGTGAPDTIANTVNRASTVAYYALVSRLVIWALAVASHALIQDYDSALELVLPIETPSQQLFKSIFGVFLRWDSFYFVHIAEKGYVFEQEHAFFPLVPALMTLISNTILAPLGAFLTYRQLLVLAGVLVANVSFIVASVQLYKLTNALFGREKFAFLSAMLYVLTPSGIFMSAMNVGFLRYYEIKQIPNFLMAAPMITLCASGIVYYTLYDLPRAISLGRSATPVPSNGSTPPFMSTKTFPYIVLWTALLFSAVTTMHIQIITRAFSCLPPVYWFAAHQFEGKVLGAGWTKSVSTFFVMYGLVGIVLFANFFPPA
ncbi:hypothetical protein BGZ80_011050 [Entomortierella chlamydospora]|uniref:GPI mannosyltransferase 2 n=1 Tax=Entomortierella chlamydospora TaxID=101097 RepID=A0A9P6MTU5_9FUNG|nr:hypothetical protein BGZ80_011050 [Entomortierella chlamydospora]